MNSWMRWIMRCLPVLMRGCLCGHGPATRWQRRSGPTHSLLPVWPSGRSRLVSGWRPVPIFTRMGVMKAGCALTLRTPWLRSYGAFWRITKETGAVQAPQKHSTKGIHHGAAIVGEKSLGQAEINESHCQQNPSHGIGSLTEVRSLEPPTKEPEGQSINQDKGQQAGQTVFGKHIEHFIMRLPVTGDEAVTGTLIDQAL